MIVILQSRARQQHKLEQLGTQHHIFWTGFEEATP